MLVSLYFLRNTFDNKYLSQNVRQQKFFE